MTPFVLVAMLTLLAVVTFAGAWWFLGGPQRELRRLEAEAAPAEIPPLDPMVLCPRCALLGSHSLDEVERRPARHVELPDGEVIEIGYIGPSHYFQRQCMFCEHVWTVPLSARS